MSVPKSASASDVTAVAKVDLDRYLGLWYEFARFPAWFQRGCTGVTAEYSRRDDGLIQVVNSCRKGSLDGKLKQSIGRAKIVDPESNAKLKVSFFGPFWGDYWIIGLDPKYQWAVVGLPNRKYLWILSREPTINPELYQQILRPLPAMGYDLSNLSLTQQSESAPTD